MKGDKDAFNHECFCWPSYKFNRLLSTGVHRPWCVVCFPPDGLGVGFASDITKPTLNQPQTIPKPILSQPNDKPRPGLSQPTKGSSKSHLARVQTGFSRQGREQVEDWTSCRFLKQARNKWVWAKTKNRQLTAGEPSLCGFPFMYKTTRTFPAKGAKPPEPAQVTSQVYHTTI